MEPFVEALKRVGRDLTREKLVAEMEKMKDFQGIMGRVSYTPFDPNDPLAASANRRCLFGQATADGKSKVLTNWIHD